MPAQPKAKARARTKPKAAATEDAASATGARSESWVGRLKAHRHRQASVATILDRTFGRFADSRPELWERRAYLMLVGLVYERLAAGGDEIPTAELASLAKLLAENRRARVGTIRKSKGSNDRASRTGSLRPGKTGPLPSRFAELVRQVYGTNLHSSDSTKPHRHANAQPSSAAAIEPPEDISTADGQKSPKSCGQAL